MIGHRGQWVGSKIFAFLKETTAQDCFMEWTLLAVGGKVEGLSAERSVSLQRAHVKYKIQSDAHIS